MAGSDTDADQSDEARPSVETADAQNQGPSATRAPDNRRVAVWLERTIFAFVLLSLCAGVWAAADPHVRNCDPNGNGDFIGAAVLLFGGAIPAVTASVLYLARLAHPNRRRSVQIAGVAAVALAILETGAALVWLFVNTVTCFE